MGIWQRRPRGAGGPEGGAFVPRVLQIRAKSHVKAFFRLLVYCREQGEEAAITLKVTERGVYAYMGRGVLLENLKAVVPPVYGLLAVRSDV